MMQRVMLLAFSEVGETLGGQIKEEWERRFGTEAILCRCMSGELSRRSEQGFREADALIFIGAAGIAVRAIAPFVEDKTTDPAVLCVDEGGSFVIPLLSGHLGGANALAEEVAQWIKAIPVITTATDIHHTFAVDVWAKGMGLGIQNPEKIKEISASVLSGKEVKVTAGDAVLSLLPKRYVLGIGMKKGADASAVSEDCALFLQRHQVKHTEIGAIATIDLKRLEPALLALQKELGVAAEFYTAEELMEVEGEFSSSEFVKQTTGADNVCERAALRLARGFSKDAKLSVSKEVESGVTFALAWCRQPIGWQWR